MTIQKQSALWVLGLCVALIPAPAAGLLSEPSHVIYGAVTACGEQPQTGAVIAAHKAGEPDPVAEYVFRSEAELGDLFRLDIPLDSLDPQLPGTLRPGDEIEIFIRNHGVPGCDELAGRGLVGARGSFRQLDLDPLLVATPSVSIDDVALAEGARGEAPTMVFTVSLSQISESAVEVNWATDDDNPSATATQHEDYNPANGVATINPGDSSALISIIIEGDEEPEPDEVFFVELVSALGANILDPLGQGTILDDDTPPTVSIGNAHVTEPQSGSVEAVFRVSLSHAWDQDVGFDYLSREGTATAAVDYLSVFDSGSIPAGSLETTLEVEVLADTEDESDETFFVDLSGAVNATILDGEGKGTILDRNQFLIFQEAEENGVGLDGLAGSFAVAVSPDGAHVYAAGRLQDSLLLFDRDPVTGQVTFAPGGERYQDGVGGVDGLNGPEAVLVSADGANVYVAGFEDDAVAVFSRETDSGSANYGHLTLLEVERNGFNDPTDIGPTVTGLDGAAGLAESPDGRQVYAAGFTSGAIAVFDRAAAGGRLSFLEAEKDGVDEPTDGSGNPVNGLAGASAVTVSSDGDHLYAAGLLDDAVAIFERNPNVASGNFGRLSFVEFVKDGIGGVDGLAGARSLALDPNGEHLYVAGQDDDAIAVFRRSDNPIAADYGELTFQQVVRNSAGKAGLLGASAVAVSFDSEIVYAAGFLDDAIAAFRRETDSGSPDFGDLELIEFEQNGIGAVEGLDGANGLAVSSDDQSVYVAAANDNALVVFLRDLLDPTDPGVFNTDPHAAGVFSNDNTITVEWSGASDNAGGTGLQGYSFLFDQAAATLPDEVVDVIHTTDAHTATSAPLPDGKDHHFHLRTCDWAGNCTSTVHLGPFFVDTAAPSAPAGVVSTSHTPGLADPVNSVIDMVWNPSVDPGGANASGVIGYFVRFDNVANGSCSPASDAFTAATSIDSGSLPDGGWNFHICGVDSAGNVSSTVSVGPFLLGNDFLPPIVTAVSSIAQPQIGAFADGVGVDRPVTQIVLTFSESILGADVASNFELVEAGGNETLQTVSCAGAVGDDVMVSISGATYTDAVRQAAVKVTSSTGLADGYYRLIVCASGISDLVGLLLDGDADGNGGDDFSVDFEVLYDRLAKNPNLDGDLADWILTLGGVSELSFSPEDVEGALTSGSARFENLTAPNHAMAISQCIDLDGLTAGMEGFVARGRAKIVKATPGDPQVFSSALFYSGLSCGGVELASIESSSVTGDTGGAWKEFSTSFDELPASARSVLLSAVVQAGPAADFSFEALVDRIEFFLVEVIPNFTDGFESGDRSRWSGAKPKD